MTCTSASSAASAEKLPVQQNEVAQWRGQSSRAHADPFNQITLDAIVTLPDGSEQRHQAVQLPLAGLMDDAHVAAGDLL